MSADAVLVTGGAGFLGQHLARRLLRAGCRVRLLDTKFMAASDLGPAAEFFHGDVRNGALLNKAMAGVRWVFHAAAIQPVARAGSEFHGVNVDGTRAVLESALRHGTERVIHVSSSAVYWGKMQTLPVTETTPLYPLGQYGRTKADAELVCRLYRTKGLNVDILRPRVLLGAGRLGIFQFLFDRIRKGKRAWTIGPGSNLLQFLSVTDMAEACWLTASRQAEGSEDFCLGTDRFGTVRQDLEGLICRARSQSRLSALPSHLVKSILGVLDGLRLSPLVDIHYRTPDRPFYFDITKARTKLGFKPAQSNIEMLAEAYEWFLAHPNHDGHVSPGFLRCLDIVS